MSLAKITLIGQETRLKMENKSVFDLLTLPDGIDKNTCIDNIILECGEFETLYSDPFFMRAAIGTWGAKHYRTFEKWINALNIDYNPLENYDRQEDWTDTLDSDTTNRNVNTASENTDSTTNTTLNTTVSTTGEQTDSGSVENTVSAFDANTYQPSEKSDTNNTTNTSTDSTTDSTNNTTSDIDFTHNSTSTDTGTKDDTSVHTGRIHGNVGVTTSQQMLQSEIDISRFNIIQEITNLFMVELCIMVYE